MALGPSPNARFAQKQKYRDDERVSALSSKADLSLYE